jgi:hypothetical protein
MMRSKAAVAKALKDKGIPFPAEDSYSAMMHRLNTWGEGKGYLFRRIKSRFYAKQNLPAEIPFGTIVWVPDSDFARNLIKTGAMFPMGRAFFQEGLKVIDVPQTEEYAEPKAEPKKKATPKKKTPKKAKKVSDDGDNGGADS